MDYRQERFDVDDYESRKECIQAKNRRAKELRGERYKVVSMILKNQVNVEGTRIRDIFMISIYGGNGR